MTSGWPRDRSTAIGGGLSTAIGGGLSTAIGGGMSTAIGGGLSTAAGSHYKSNIPPIHIFIPYLRRYGYGWAADMLARAHNLDL